MCYDIGVLQHKVPVGRDRLVRFGAGSHDPVVLRNRGRYRLGALA